MIQKKSRDVRDSSFLIRDRLQQLVDCLQGKGESKTPGPGGIPEITIHQTLDCAQQNLESTAALLVDLDQLLFGSPPDISNAPTMIAGTGAYGVGGLRTR